MIIDLLRESLRRAAEAVGFEIETINLERPADLKYGDYATNMALMLAKTTGQKPLALAQQIAQKFKVSPLEFPKVRPWLERVEVVDPGFINFFLKPQALAEIVSQVLKTGERFGWYKGLAGEKVIVEYTDPNPFKEFHIGHLMSNTIGESVSRLIESSGAEVKRACYQGDVGLHVAKAIWGKLKVESEKLKKGKSWGEAYATGTRAYEADEYAKQEIEVLNKKIYAGDPEIKGLYEQGRKESLDQFEKIYQILGTHFDFYFFESETGEFGRKIVEASPVFEPSDGAIVFRGERHGLHTRVFINSQGLPTYEAKELGLAKIKYDKYPYTRSVVVTGNEINEYFKVLLQAMKLIFPDLAAKTKHLSHGMLRLSSGKMSSRTGNVITGESLLQAVIEKVKTKMAERGFTDTKLEQIASSVAVAAIKYSILKQAPGRDIIFDEDKSLALEGDSGPYLQYTYVRARSVLKKAGREFPAYLAGRPATVILPPAWTPTTVERLLIHFPEAVRRAGQEFAPQLIITYLLALAGAFNAYYATERIVGSPEEDYKLALVQAVSQVLKNGLWLLGLAAPEEM